MSLYKAKPNILAQRFSDHGIFKVVQFYSEFNFSLHDFYYRVLIIPISRWYRNHDIAYNYLKLID